MSSLEIDTDRLETLATRLTEIVDELESDGEREHAVGNVVLALRRYGVGEGWFAKHDAIEKASTKFVSRTVAGARRRFRGAGARSRRRPCLDGSGRVGQRAVQRWLRLGGAFFTTLYNRPCKVLYRKSVHTAECEMVDRCSE